MQRYNILDIKKLKEFLYQSNVHDSRLENWMYDTERKSFYVGTTNPVFGTRIDLVFQEVIAIIAISGRNPGDNDVILSLTAEEDFSLLNGINRLIAEKSDELLYLVFQMLSGYEVHVIAKYICIN